jgi:hypothetical protein
MQCNAPQAALETARAAGLEADKKLDEAQQHIKVRWLTEMCCHCSCLHTSASPSMQGVDSVWL